MAAEYSISRRKLSDTQCNSVMTYPSPDPLEGVTTMEFYGQRPWRVGKSEPVDQNKEKEGIDAMLYREKKVKHSKIILESLSAAISQYQMFKCPRMTTKLVLQKAEEMMATMEYSEALQTLLPCLPTYRQEHWYTLTYSVLAIALKCSFLSCDLQSYSALCLELCGLPCDSVQWLTDEQTRVWSNYLQIMETGKPPLPEPSLTAKHERASVASATKSWTQLLAEKQHEEIVITEFDSCVDIIVQMPVSVKTNEEILVKVIVCYRGEGDISVKDVECSFELSKYDCKSEETIQFSQPGEKEILFKLTPDPRDVGQSLTLKHASLLLGSRDIMTVRLLKKCPVTEEKENYFKSGKKIMQAECNIEPQNSDFKISIEHDTPVLVGEWFRLSVNMENIHDEDATDLEVTLSLKDRSDPLLTDTTVLSLAPDTPVSPTSSDPDMAPDHSSVMATLDKLGNKSNGCVSIYVQASTGGERVMVLQLSCLLGQRKCSDSQLVVLDVIQPFEFVTNYLTEALEETTNCNTDEEFFVSCAVKNNSDHSLVVVGAVMEGCHPVTVTTHKAADIHLDLLPQSSVETIFGGIVPAGAMVPQLDSQTLTPGKLVLSWSRHNTPHIVNVTTFDLPSLKLSRASLYVTCHLPPYGVLRSQLQAKYIFSNRTQEIQQFLINIEPSDAYMFSGPKQFNIKLFPLDQYIFNLVIYPLMCGVTALPKVKVSSTEGTVAQVNILFLLE